MISDIIRIITGLPLKECEERPCSKND